MRAGRRWGGGGKKGGGGRWGGGRNDLKGRACRQRKVFLVGDEMDRRIKTKGREESGAESEPI